MTDSVDSLQAVGASVPDEQDGGASSLYSLYEDCTLCPRRCHANRHAGQLGLCGASDKVRVARAALHYWEEPPISGESGSGTVFFAHCQLQCVYCQNAQISRSTIDASSFPWATYEVTTAHLAQIFLDLQAKGANNINLVTATQYLPSVVDAIHQAREGGLTVPIVYNTGGYETLKTIRLLSGVVDIYLTDLKHRSKDLAEKYSHASNYPEVAIKALDEMVSQVGAPVYYENQKGETLLASGVVVRHLLLPGLLDEAEDVVRYLGTEYGDRIVVSLMNQYVPLVDEKAYPEIACHVDQSDYDNLVEFSRAFDFAECFIQEKGSDTEDFIPSFTGEGVLPGA